MLRQDQFIKAQLALAAWRHGHRYGGVQSMLLMAHAIANRQRAGWGEWLDVIDRIPLFSARNLEEQPGGQPSLADPNFIRLLQEIDGIYDASREDPTHGSLYWGDMSEITRDWFKQEIVAKPDVHPRTVNCALLQCWK